MKITLDPGHGQYGNPGAITGYFEGTRMFFLAGYLKTELLKYKDTEVFITRDKISSDPSLSDRGKKAVNTGSELFISLHSNGFSSPKAHGVSVFRSIKHPESVVLGKLLGEAVVKTMKAETGITYLRGVVTRTYENALGTTLDYYGVIRSAVSGDTVKNAFIIEHGFHSNPTECAFVYSDENLQKLAAVEAEVIAKYFSLEKDIDAEEEPEYTVYYVKAGDTLSKIAKRFDTTWRVLAEYNSLDDPDKIFVGEKIKIPIPDEIRPGDIVRLKKNVNTYYPGGNLFKKWVTEYDYAVEKIADSKGNPVYRNRARCILLGKRINRTTGAVYGSIKSWASIEYIEKIK